METGVCLHVHLSRLKRGFLRVLFLLWLGSLCATEGRQRFANEPSPQTAVIGSTVVLPCRVINKTGELQWTRDGFGLGDGRNLFAYERYKMIGSDDEGDYSLKISPVTLDDDSEFQCQVTGSKGNLGVRSQTAKLTVYVPPEPPELTHKSVVRTTAGAGVRLECVSKGGKPAAEIQWLDGSDRVISDGVNYTKYLLEDGHRYNAKSTFTLIAGRQHHNAVFTCTASNAAIRQPLKNQVRLEVTYPPEVTITQDKSGYKETENATLTCSATANPSQLTYRWYRGGVLVSDANSTQLVIRDVRRDVASEDIVCEAANSVGTTKKITRLAVHYGPRFRVRPKDIYAEEGEDVTLKCEVDGSPDPKIVWWIPQRNSSIFGNGPTLSLKAGKDTVGAYTCLAKVEDFPEISTRVGLFLKGPPTIRAERSQWGELGSTVSLDCFIPSATANSVTVSWSRKGRRLGPADRRYELKKEMTSDGLSVRLVIKRSKIEDFDDYNCSVQNDYGTDLVDIVLKRKKTVPVVLIVAGVVGSVLVVIIIIGAVILFGRRNTAKHKDIKNGGLPEKSISLQINDQNSNSNDSDLKVEIDNRTGSSLSSKNADLEQSWEKEEIMNGIEAGSPTFLSNGVTFLYPEAFSRIPLKVNGHVISSGGGLTYTDYTDHTTLASSPAPLIQKPQHAPLSSGFSVVGSGFSTTGSGFSPRSIAPLVTSSQHNIYHGFQPEFEVTPDSVEGLRGLSSAFSNGFANQNYKNNTSTLPLSLHLNRNSSVNQSVVLSSSNSISPPMNAPNNRLGIPVDSSSQYIVPPRTQILQGALATHV